MAKKNKTSGYISNGERSNVSKWTRKSMKRSVPPIISLHNKWNAFIKNKRVMVTIPNPNKGETKRPFIRVTAKEAGWKKPEPYRMKQD